MNPTLLGTFLGLYLLFMPLTVTLICLAHTRLVVRRAMERASKSKIGMQNLPKRLWPRVKERLSFAFRDKRDLVLGKKPVSGLQNRMVLFGFWGLGLALFLAAPALELWVLLAPGALAFYTAVLFGYFSPKVVLETRKKVMDKMFNIGSSKLSISSEYRENPGAVIKVLEWEDYVKPVRAEFNFPDTFSDSGMDGFMAQFNLGFGGERTWVPADDPETGAPGWDFENTKVTIYAVPPLPRLAPWHERYVLSPGIAWSFFPLALGVENGVELKNTETGETENVLGFDLSGIQVDVGKKAGLKVSPTITTSPMCLIAGGTGGGKSLSTNTLVRVFASAPTKPREKINFSH